MEVKHIEKIKMISDEIYEKTKNTALSHLFSKTTLNGKISYELFYYHLRKIWASEGKKISLIHNRKMGKKKVDYCMVLAAYELYKKGSSAYSIWKKYFKAVYKSPDQLNRYFNKLKKGDIYENN